MKFIIIKLILLLGLVLLPVDNAYNFSITDINYLNPSKYLGCLTPCDSYHAGADINSTLVCTYQAYNLNQRAFLSRTLFVTLCLEIVSSELRLLHTKMQHQQHHQEI